MTQIAEYEGERFLYVEEEALEPTNALSNTAQWNELKDRLTAVLTERGIEAKKWDFRKSHYKHGGTVHLTLKYILQPHHGVNVEGH